MIKKIFVVLLVIFGGVACSKHDPILPGERIDIFDNNDVEITGAEIPDLSDVATNIYGDENCEYRQDSSNTIWFDDKKVFSGFATVASVKSNQKPICDGGFVYTGLSTGEVVKINPKNKKIVWVADVFRVSNLTGGASVIDIVARVGVDKKFVYAGGLGDAFCKLNKNSGDKIWCVNISVPVDFIVVDNFAFVVGTDNNLYAIDINTGGVYWKAEIKKQVKPIYEKNLIIVGNQKVNYKNGQIVK